MPVLSLFKQPKKQKSRRSRLIKTLDDLMSKRVRERDSHRCRRCGRIGRVFHHHIFTKQRLSTRWLMDNGVTLDFYCHRWAHSAGEEFRAWVISWMGQKEYDRLYLVSQMRGGFKETDLEWMIKDMRDEKIIEECGL